MKRALPLQKLVHEAARSATRDDVASAAVTAARELFGVHIAGCFLVDPTLTPTDVVVRGATVGDIDEYTGSWRDADTVLGATFAEQRPMHNRMVHTERAWKAEIIYREYAKRLEIEHYMTVPLFARGGLAGTMHLCRRPNDIPFTGDDAQIAAVLSGIVSVNLATLPRSGERPTYPLTRRELEIAQLVMAGKNNLEVARALGIARETVKQTLRRVYEKLEVRGRAEMAAVLARLGLG